jgi:uncharacterized protein (TIGR02271 family)
MEKVKDKLHMGHKDHSSDFTSSSHHSTTTASSHHTGHTTGVAAVPVMGVAAMPLATGAYDSRDLNRDGHISTGEKLASGTAFQESEATRLKLHEEQLAISKRQVGAGEIGIHKRVEQEHVQQSIPVRREEVTVERRPLSGVAEPGARIAEQDEYVRVPLHKEEIVTEKRIVPTEEVIVRKKEITENQVVGDTLRSEYVETDKLRSTTAGFDARDTNHDGHVSMGEKFKSGSTTGAYDARDTNRDGHVSMGEKLKGDAAGFTGAKAARG